MAKTARKTAASADVEFAVIEAAMQLAVERGWRRVALADIAAHANLPLPELYDRFPSKAAILGAMSRRADWPPRPATPPRTRPSGRATGCSTW